MKINIYAIAKISFEGRMRLEKLVSWLWDFGKAKYWLRGCKVMSWGPSLFKNQVTGTHFVLKLRFPLGQKPSCWSPKNHMFFLVGLSQKAATARPWFLWNLPFRRTILSSNNWNGSTFSCPFSRCDLPSHKVKSKCGNSFYTIYPSWGDNLPPSLESMTRN